MFIPISKAAVTGLVLLASIYPQVSEAETFTSAELLNWSTESQRSYIQTSVGMASVIASQISDTKAGCIGRWYFDDNRARLAEIHASMKKNSQFHPQAVILALMQKACGRFGR